MRQVPWARGHRRGGAPAVAGARAVGGVPVSGEQVFRCRRPSAMWCRLPTVHGWVAGLRPLRPMAERPAAGPRAPVSARRAAAPRGPVAHQVPMARPAPGGDGPATARPPPPTTAARRRAGVRGPGRWQGLPPYHPPRSTRVPTGIQALGSAPSARTSVLRGCQIAPRTARHSASSPSACVYAPEVARWAALSS